MKKLFLFLSLSFLTFIAFSQTNKNMTWDGVNRQYIEIDPSNVTTPKPVLFVLHGLGGSSTDMATFIPQDRPDWYYIVPQGLDIVINPSIMGSPMFEQPLNIGAGWNIGATVTLSMPGMGQIPIPGLNFGAEIQIGEADDEGFFNAILQDLINNGNVDTDSIFFTGFSLGGYMTNKMGVLHGDYVKGIASISGTIGNDICNATNTENVNALHIHGTNDEVIDYYTGKANIPLDNMIGGIGIGIDQMFGEMLDELLSGGLDMSCTAADATVNYWVNRNSCSTTPAEYTYPDLAQDGLNFTRKHYLYGNNNARTGFIKVWSGTHSMYSTPDNDIDYFTEIINFFRDQWNDEVVPPANYTVSGTVTLNGNPLSGVNIAYTGGTTTTAANGNYSFTVAAGSACTITPSLNGYTFTPTNISISSVNSNTPNQNFVATSTQPQTHTVSGTVTLNGNPLANVSIAYTGGMTTTAANGTYSFQIANASNCSITPSLAGYTFAPQNINLNSVTSDMPNQNFVATSTQQTLYTVSGSVTLNGNPLANVNIAYTGGMTTTTANGTYNFQVVEGSNCVITPSLSGYTFAPENITLNNITANMSNQNFVATETNVEPPSATYTVSGKITYSGMTISQVTVTYNEATVQTNNNGVYTFTVAAGTTVVITPSSNVYAFTPASITIENISSDMPNQDFVATLADVELNTINKFTVYPNPTTNLINVSVNQVNAKMEIYNIVGEKLMEKTLTSDENTIDLSGLAKGNYIIKIDNEIEKIVIQ